MTVQLSELIHISRKLLQVAKRGNLYLVDVGRLVPIAAVSPRDAYAGARACRAPFSAYPQIYRVDPEGKIIAECA